MERRSSTERPLRICLETLGLSEEAEEENAAKYLPFYASFLLTTRKTISYPPLDEF
jgi:hypothetical protein